MPYELKTIRHYNTGPPKGFRLCRSLLHRAQPKEVPTPSINKTYIMSSYQDYTTIISVRQTPPAKQARSPSTEALSKEIRYKLIGQDVKRIARLPLTIPNAFIHASLRERGLGICSLLNSVPAILLQRLNNLAAIRDHAAIESTFETGTLQKIPERIGPLPSKTPRPGMVSDKVPPPNTVQLGYPIPPNIEVAGITLRPSSYALMSSPLRHDHLAKRIADAARDEEWTVEVEPNIWDTEGIRPPKWKPLKSTYHGRLGSNGRRAVPVGAGNSLSPTPITVEEATSRSQPQHNINEANHPTTEVIQSGQAKPAVPSSDPATRPIQSPLREPVAIQAKQGKPGNSQFQIAPEASLPRGPGSKPPSTQRVFAGAAGYLATVDGNVPTGEGDCSAPAGKDWASDPDLAHAPDSNRYKNSPLTISTRHNFDLIKMASAKTVYTTEERIDLIKLYIENGRSAAATLRKFKAKYGPNTQKWRETGSVTDDKTSLTGRPVTVTIPEAVDKVRDLYTEEPTTSTTRASQVFNISRRERPMRVLSYVFEFNSRGKDLAAGKFDTHLPEKDLSGIEKQNAKTSNSVVAECIIYRRYCYAQQKMHQSFSYYASTLNVFNLTAYQLQTNEVYCYVSHERGTCVCSYLKTLQENVHKSRDDKKR
ncbi:hypothetical protein ILUMI_05267 [Ignelater luminosus]|uniref:DUF4817 domain-containing protein n=1 Tax=Ignelater luminosus TaxID=2038154 RepID=A0A8K0DCV5_IGNLU|nr:hypothetical protein ILUMI_05267 [Ignelater luminosus]